MAARKKAVAKKGAVAAKKPAAAKPAPAKPAPKPAAKTAARPGAGPGPGVGDRAPDFTLPTDSGSVSLSGLRGRPVVVYFYPKDDTPGCTIQGKSFTATKSEYDAEGVTVVGLSPDDVGSHKAFCDKFAFTIELLADPEAKLLGALGAGQSEWKGTMYWNRTTFVIDPSGVVRKVYTGVKPEGHEKVVLDELRALRR